MCKISLKICNCRCLQRWLTCYWNGGRLSPARSTAAAAPRSISRRPTATAPSCARSYARGHRERCTRRTARAASRPSTSRRGWATAASSRTCWTAGGLPRRRGAPRRRRRDLRARRGEGEAVLGGIPRHRETQAAGAPGRAGPGREHAAPPRGGRRRARCRGGSAPEGQGPDGCPEQRRAHAVRSRHGIDKLLHHGEQLLHRGHDCFPMQIPIKVHQRFLNLFKNLF